MADADAGAPCALRMCGAERRDAPADDEGAPPAARAAACAA
jgi:hypothetical protein